jgi:preprotein translocase subunit SecA
VPVKRIDEDYDEFYKNTTDKFQAIAKLIRECQRTRQPVLVGTVSIEKSELLSEYPQKEGVKHNVLNARFHERRRISSRRPENRRGDDRHQHGRTRHRHPAWRQCRDSASRRAEGHGRGPKGSRDRDQGRSRRKAERLLESGGLYVVGTERHESRRIDNQLRGRSGRQGDPGLLPSSTSASKTICCASSGRTRCLPT